MTRRRIGLLATVAAVSLLFAACGSDTSSSTPPTTTPDTTTPDTTTPDTTTPDTTSPDTTTPDTTSPATPIGWTVVDPATVALPLAVPCCASNWSQLATSPAFPADGQPLADGIYRIEWTWPVAPAGTVTATVRRFAPCGELPDSSCEPPPEGQPFPADDFGVDPTTEYGLALPLDDSIAVVLGGFRGFQATDNFATGNGLDLLDLVRSVDADFETTIMQPYLAGTSEAALVAQLVAAPTNGFGGAPEQGGQLSYTHADAPPLLFQALFYDFEQPEASRGSDVMGPIALLVEDGAYTVSVFAGFYS